MGVQGLTGAQGILPGVFPTPTQRKQIQQGKNQPYNRTREAAGGVEQHNRRADNLSELEYQGRKLPAQQKDHQRITHQAQQRRAAANMKKPFQGINFAGGLEKGKGEHAGKYQKNYLFQGIDEKMDHGSNINNFEYKVKSEGLSLPPVGNTDRV